MGCGELREEFGEEREVEEKKIEHHEEKQEHRENFIHPFQIAQDPTPTNPRVAHDFLASVALRVKLLWGSLQRNKPVNKP